MAFPSVTYTITNGTPNDGSQVAQNFSDCINAMKDGTKDFSISALTVGGVFTLSSTISSALTPTTNTFYDLGSATKGWSSLYLGGSSTFTIKLAAPALGASYTITLPAAVPTATFPLFMSSAGTITAQSSKGEQISSTCGNYSTSSATYVDVTNLTVSITTTGRPVMILMQGASGGTKSSEIAGTTATTHAFQLLRGASVVCDYSYASDNIVNNVFSGAVVLAVDTPVAGTYTYKVQAKTTAGTTQIIQYVLVAYEL